MAQVKVFDQDKKDAGNIDLNPEVFEVAVRPEILNLVVRAQRAAWRAGTHATLTRSMMKGGGAKPWRQKGTGRARSGSNVSPLWTGGAITFGPHPRGYDFKVNKKVWRLAVKMALSSRLQGENLVVVKDFTMVEAKTRHFVKIKNALGLGKTLIVAPADSKDLILAARNVPDVTVITPEQLNVYDILAHKHLVLTEAVVENVVARFTA